MTTSNYRRAASRAAFAVLGAGLDKEANWFTDGISGAYHAVADPLSNAVNNMGSGIKNFAGGVADQFNNLANAPLNVIGGAVQGGMSSDGTAGGFAKSVIDGGWNAGANSVNNIGKGWDRMTGGAKSFGQGAGDAVTTAVNSPVNAVVGGANGVWNTEGGGADMVRAAKPAVDYIARGVNNGWQTQPAAQPATQPAARPTAPQSGGGWRNTVNGWLNKAGNWPVPDWASEYKQPAPQSGGGWSDTVNGWASKYKQPEGWIGTVNGWASKYKQPAPQSGGGWSDTVNGWASKYKQPAPQSGGGWSDTVNGFHPAASPQHAPAPQGYQGPTNDDYKRIMGSYDPNSSLDRRKAQAIQDIWRQNGGRVSPNQIYRDSRYSQIKSGSVTPFAALNGEMEKEAFMRALSKALKWGGGKIQAGAKAMAPKSKLGGTGDAMAAAQKRFDLGSKFNRGGMKIDALADISPALYKALNIGVPTVAGGTALYGANRLGHGSGLEEGMTQGMERGYDVGAQVGIQQAMANTPQDPGILGRIFDVFRGRQAGPDPNELYGAVTQGKPEILRALREGGMDQ